MEPSVELPLLERAQEGDAAFCLTTAVETAEGLVASLCGVGSNLQLPPPPGPGEQYRFHFDMTKCIGCKCCVVACNEQNGNPADILWRRVGEIEGGVYPDTLRHYLSMGCNHCLEPTCMTDARWMRIQRTQSLALCATVQTLASDVSTAPGIVRMAYRSTTLIAASLASAICATEG